MSSNESLILIFGRLDVRDEGGDAAAVIPDEGMSQ